MQEGGLSWISLIKVEKFAPLPAQTGLEFGKDDLLLLFGNKIIFPAYSSH